MTPDFLAGAATTLIGSGVGTAIVGLLFKRRFDHQLELQRAVLQRATRVHERQVETLVKLDQQLRAAQAYLELMSKSAIFQGEDPSKYPGKFREAIGAAHEELSSARLLLPRELSAKIEHLFKKMFEGQMALAFFYDPAVQNGAERAGYWDQAKTIAYRELPSLLDAIEQEARMIVHGSAWD